MMNSKSPEEWRRYFESGGCSIYQIIFNAIKKAALDDPEGFKLRRVEIAQRLYSCQFTGTCSCLDHQTEQDVHNSITQVLQHCRNACAHRSDKKVDDSGVGGGRKTDQRTNERANNVEDDDGAENIRRVLQIKNALDKNQLTDTEIHESLRKLKLEVQSVAVMKSTKIGSTISNLKRHRSKEISLLATTMADKWKSMIVEFVDKAAEARGKPINPVPDLVLEEWREFPSVEFVLPPPAELKEKLLDDVDDYENAAGNDKEKNGTEERKKNAAKENETTEKKKLQEDSVKKGERTKEDSVEKFTSGRSKGHVRVEKTTEKNPSTGNKRKLEDAGLNTPKAGAIRQKPASMSAPNTGRPSGRDQELAKKEVGNYHSEPRNRYRALLINAEPRRGSPPARESRRSADNTANEEMLETSKNKLQEGYVHERANRNIRMIPEGYFERKASSSRSKNQNPN